MARPGQSSSNPLPAKELGLFKKIIKSYEQKQYKFGLKYAKAILTNPLYVEHGETLAMKGLILNCLGKQQEAQDCVKRGLRSDIRSYVCWHVYGLVQRADKKYDDAIKSYKQALKLDKDNMQILRDLSLLQIQMRDYEGYKESRYHLLRLRPNQKVNWIGYATAYHLARDYDKALNIVSEFISTNQPSTSFDFEHSELLLYQNMIYRESGQHQVALTNLEENAVHIYDKVTYQETRADLLMKLERKEEAGRVWRSLIERNPENLGYYDKLIECLGLETVKDKVDMFDELKAKHKRAAAPKRLVLYLVEGDELRSRLHTYICEGLRKGVPSLFKNLTPLYSTPSKVAVIEALLVDFVKKIEDNGYRNGSLDGRSDEMETPSTALWLYLLIAQHYDRIGQSPIALSYADKAQRHTPTLIETLMIRAKILKHSGDVEEAARVMDEAQSLDTADRYINSKCAKYLLRAGLMEEAEKMCSKFTREGERASVTLNDMQCMWYEIETARAYRKLSKYGDALRKAHQIEQHFVGMVEDQFDFHTYCLRKTTISAYIHLLRLEDVLRRHDFYYQGAKLAIKIYLRMIDRPQDMAQQNGIQDGMSAAEIKKMKKKMKKLAEKEEEQKKNHKNEGNPAMQFDVEALLKPENPLEEAAKFAQPLHMLGSGKPAAYALAFEVYLRKNKVLIMLKCLRKGWQLDPAHPQLHVCRVKYLKYAETATLAGAVSEVAEELSKDMFSTKCPKQLNDLYKQQAMDSLLRRMAVAECSVLLEPENESTMRNWLLKSLEDDKLTDRTLKNVHKLYDGVSYGRYGSWTKEEKDSLVRLGHQLFPLAQVFGASQPASNSTPVADGSDNHVETTSH